MDKKYILTDEVLRVRPRPSAAESIVHRIKAIRDFGDVKAGDFGGWVESEENLSQTDGCWIYNDAIVCEQAWVRGHAHIRDGAAVYGDAYVSAHAKVTGGARISGQASVAGFAEVGGIANLGGLTNVGEHAVIKGTTSIYGRAKICGDAFLQSRDDYFVVDPIGSRGDACTFVRTKSGGIWVTTGCFSDDLEVFEARVRAIHGDNRYGQEYKQAIEMAKMRLSR